MTPNYGQETASRASSLADQMRTQITGPAHDLAQREPQVAEQLRNLGDRLGSLDQAVDMLEKRLQSVLLPSEAQAGVKDPNGETLVPLADAIRIADRSVLSAVARIHSLERRLQL